MENNARAWMKTYNWYRKNTLKFVNAYLTGEYKLEKEPVDFMTAIKALNGGKVIYSIRTDGYKEVFNPTGKQTDWGVAVEQSQGYAVDTETILYGKWYIEDQEELKMINNLDLNVTCEIILRTVLIS